MAEQDIEFLPTDDLDDPAEAESLDAEGQAVRVDDGDGARGRMVVEDEAFDADDLDPVEADDLDAELEDDGEDEEGLLDEEATGGGDEDGEEAADRDEATGGDEGAAGAAGEAAGAGEAEADEDEAEGAEHEEDLDEILRRHYGLGAEEADGEDEPEAGTGVRTLRVTTPGEFLCPSCFLRKPTSQLTDVAGGVCADCAEDLA